MNPAPPSTSAKTEPPEDDEREPYEPPCLECEELYEVIALACGKIQPRTHACQTQNRVS